MIGVAISTTGDEHRMGFLETCVEHWKRVLPLGSVLVVTVDGSEEDASRVRDRVQATVYRVGQRLSPIVADRWAAVEGRLGVGANKNTGLELLMEAMVTHVFLCDDDTWPLTDGAWLLHTLGDEPHSMVNWGWHRMNSERTGWKWPRGALLYVRPQVIAQVGGMDERFGIGGHEHVEWSRRIHQAGLTPTLYPAPEDYFRYRGNGAAKFWHAEDMSRPGEPLGNLKLRRRQITSVKRPENYWDNAEQIMAERDGKPTYVAFRAAENGRASATIPSHSA